MKDHTSGTKPGYRVDEVDVRGLRGVASPQPRHLSVEKGYDFDEPVRAMCARARDRARPAYAGQPAARPHDGAVVIGDVQYDSPSRDDRSNWSLNKTTHVAMRSISRDES
ncbi:hypothetical protein [Streptomyces sp. NPDC001068]|uniref:hypothetical protein n=1 Tax=Streptomyces sp. NPDC001068 TaxID=3364544 RepID=UPI0036C6C481